LGALRCLGWPSTLSARMSDAFFSFGSKPALSREYAQALAQLIATDPTSSTAKLAAKINQALMDGDGAQDVELERDELAEIALSADPELLPDVPDFKALYEEVSAILLADSLWVGKRSQGSRDNCPLHETVEDALVR
jgi:hypothetical protein